MTASDASSSKIQVRLVSPFSKRHETEHAVFCNSIVTEKADALLCEWAPSEELLTFPRRKAWYCCEPACQFPSMGDGTWPQWRDRLGTHEFLFHAHHDTRYRVPHITHFQPLEMNRNVDRMNHAIAIVSNHGGSPRKRHPQIAYRNEVITQPQVDLFGRSAWRTYRRNMFAWPSAPRNYRGEIPGDWPAGEKRELQAKYKAAVCLENMCESHYFTEKFVEAVAAGCVPVYRCHETLRNDVMDGAVWIDPANFDHQPKRVLDACMDVDLNEVQAANATWLSSNASLQLTHASAVFQRIAEILAHE